MRDTLRLVAAILVVALGILSVRACIDYRNCPDPGVPATGENGMELCLWPSKDSTAHPR